MKGAPGVFTHIVDSFVLVTIKQLSVKYMLGLMDYQEAKGPEPINWIALFDFDHVDVDRVADLCNVKPKDLWPPMDRLAMKHDFLAQKVSLVEWLYSAPVKVCLRKYPKRIIRFMTYWAPTCHTLVLSSTGCIRIFDHHHYIVKLQYTTRCRTHHTWVQYPCQRARSGKHPDNSYCVQVQKVWRTLIIHCLVPKCGIPEFPLAKFGLYDNDADNEIWFRNTHNAGMVRPLMHHTLEAWDDFLPESEGITKPPSKRAWDAELRGNFPPARFGLVCWIWSPELLWPVHGRIRWRPHPVPCGTLPIFCRGRQDNVSGNYACIYMLFNIKWHIDTQNFFIRHINTTGFLIWHINKIIKLSDIHKFHKWQYMSFNLKKTYIHILYFICMSLNF